MHIYRTGEGGPAVVLDAGLSGTSLGWSLVQSEISTFTTACSYDRAGYAWSDASPLKRTSANIAGELHTLLEKAGIPGPYILVGHSFGGCNALVFADLYPGETLGVVLVDSVHEEMGEIGSQGWFQWLLVVTGYKRLKGPSPEIVRMFEPLPEKISESYIAQMNRTGYATVVSRELEGFNESLAQMAKINISVPLIVITAGIADEGWKAHQLKLLAKSTRARQIVAEKSDHMINHHEPGIIVEAVREIISLKLPGTSSSADRR